MSVWEGDSEGGWEEGRILSSKMSQVKYLFLTNYRSVIEYIANATVEYSLNLAHV